MADPVIPFHRTLLSRSSENRAAVRLAGLGSRLEEALPSPLPAVPWHEAQFAAKTFVPWLISSCKSYGLDEGCRTGALSLNPPVMAIGTPGGVALPEGSLAIAISTDVSGMALIAKVCWSKPESFRARPSDWRYASRSSASCVG